MTEETQTQTQRADTLRRLVGKPKLLPMTFDAEDNRRRKRYRRIAHVAIEVDAVPDTPDTRWLLREAGEEVPEDIARKIRLKNEPLVDPADFLLEDE